MTRLVLVPISVRVPPKTAAYARGMSSFFGLTPALLPQAIMMGISSATIGVLFSTLQATSIGKISNIIELPSCCYSSACS